MREVDGQYWLNLEADGAGFVFPNSIRSKCDACDAWSVVRLENGHTNPPACMRTASGSCPSCGLALQFVLRYAFDAAAGQQRTPILLLSTGLSPNYLGPAKVSNAAGERVVKTLSDATTAYNAARFGEASNLIRKAMEGALKKALEGKLVGNDNKKHTLYTLIDLAAQQLDLAAPLKRLALLAKDAGNVGSHFDDDGEPNAILIKEQIEATKYIIAFLFELPVAIDEMEMLLGKNTN